MTDNLKIDLISGAFSQLRISGLTVMPSPEDIVLALRRLEALANELRAVNVDVGYNFEDEPDQNSTIGIENSLWYAFEVVLAVRLMPDFGKGMKPDPLLVAQSRGAFSLIHNYSARIKPISYPSRQPVGSGNASNSLKPFYSTDAKVVDKIKTVTMFIDDVADLVEHFDAYLIDDEAISSFTISASSGLTINSSSNTDTDVLYRITADGDPDGEPINGLKVKIVITTDAGRVQTRIIYFDLKDVDV